MNAAEIMELATGYWASAALNAAAELGVFDRLASGPRSAGSLAGSLQADEAVLNDLLNALAGCGILRKNRGAFAIAPGLEAWFDPSDPGNLVEALRLNRGMYALWGRLGECVRNGAPVVPPEAHLGGDPDRTRAFVRGMHSRARLLAPALLNALEPGGRKRLLDVGCGPGTFSVRMAERDPEASAVLVDLPPILEAARDLHRDSPARDRIAWHPGDYHRDPLPEGFDAVLYCGALHQESESDAAKLFASLHESLEPGGRLFVVDLMVEPDGTEPAFAALFSLNMRMTRPHGHVYDTETARKLVAEAGFDLVRSIRLEPTAYRLIEAGR